MCRRPRTPHSKIVSRRRRVRARAEAATRRRTTKGVNLPGARTEQGVKQGEGAWAQIMIGVYVEEAARRVCSLRCERVFRILIVIVKIGAPSPHAPHLIKKKRKITYRESLFSALCVRPTVCVNTSRNEQPITSRVAVPGCPRYSWEVQWEKCTCRCSTRA